MPADLNSPDYLMSMNSTSADDQQETNTQNQTDQEDELLALQSIFANDFTHAKVGNDGVYGTLLIRVTLPDQLALRIPRIDDHARLKLKQKAGQVESVSSASTLSSSSSSQPPNASASTSSSSTIPTASTETTQRHVETVPEDTVIITHLPPVTLRFHMPPGYPSTQPLNFAIDCVWMTPSRGLRVKKKLQSMWDAGNVVLFEMSDFLQNELPEFLGLVSNETSPDHTNIHYLSLGFNEPTITTRSTSPSRSQSTEPPTAPTPKSILEHLELVDNIIQYDRKRSKELFNVSMATCGICFEEKKGVYCKQFGSCGHEYCLSCLNDYYSLLIMEGTIKQVTCPHEVCKKLTPPPILPDNDLKEIVNEELFARFKEIKEKQALEGRQDVTYCPRPHCQSPVIKEPNEEKLCVCPKCRYAFCFYCGRTWHGYVQYCRISRINEIAEMYEKADPKVKLQMEIQYGKRILEKAVRDLDEEKANMVWLKGNTKTCPLCGDKISASDPYQHFSTRGKPCYGKLFAFTDSEGNEINPDGGDGGGRGNIHGADEFEDEWEDDVINLLG
ncbi:E3 ubiquitin-protein ligase rnf14 [Blyttiomyces sp. JEL0837]|nr:E3 ubiquitin-protein ligase rnf14 [Blyttiomyces sp. JEL0837]